MVLESLDSLAPPGFVDGSTSATKSYGHNHSSTTATTYTGCAGACTINKPACLAGCPKPCCKKVEPVCPKPACPKVEKPACPKNCCKPCCKPVNNWSTYVIAYVVWFIIATIIFYIIFAVFKPGFLMDDDKKHGGGHGDHGGHHNDGKGTGYGGYGHGHGGHGSGGHGHDDDFNVAKAIGAALLCALISLIILQLILWVVGY